MERYKYVDVARGTGMMLVVIAHCNGLSNYLIYFFMQLFFILSGWLYQPGRTYIDNIKRKARRLLIPYFGYSLLLLVFYYLAGRSWEETKFSLFGILYSRGCIYDTSITAVEDNIFLLDVANGGMWYLTAYFMSCVVFYLLIDKCLQSKKFAVWCMIGLTILTMLLAELPVLLPWSMDIAFVGAAFMIVGVLLRRTEFFEQEWNWKLAAVIFVCYVTLVTINPGLNTSVREYGIYERWSVPFYMLIGVTGSILCIWFARMVQDTFIGSFLVGVGQNTIVLLAFHILGLEVFEIIAGKFVNVGGLNGIYFALYNMARIAVSLGGCWILAKGQDAVKMKVRGHVYEKGTKFKL